MKILITGAGGLVGSRLAAALAGSREVIAAGHSDLDVTDVGSIRRFVGDHRPELIINCAVIGVDECETDPKKANAVNVEGPSNLAKEANECGAAIVHFSTNYVFGGDRSEGFYTIDDEPRPVNNYGRTKWLGEKAVIAGCDRSFIIRTSWVYGGGKNSFFDNSIAALRKRESVEAIDDNWASTTDIGDLVARVIEIVERGCHGTFHVVNDGVCSKYEFAAEAAKALGADADLVIPVRSSESKFVAMRPRYTPMKCRLSDEIGLPPLRDWRRALSEFVV